MKCLIAVKWWIQEGGYLCIRRSRSPKRWGIHFLHATGLTGVRHKTVLDHKDSFAGKLRDAMSGKWVVLNNDDGPDDRPRGRQYP